MINSQPESLPTVTDNAFREWLRKEPAQTLKRIVESRLKEHECKALRDAIQSSVENYKLESANANLRLAQRYAIFLEVLKELENTPPTTPFTTVKLT